MTKKVRRIALGAAGVGATLVIVPGLFHLVRLARAAYKTASGDPALHIERSVLIARSCFDTYLAWRNVERLPRLLQHLTSVTRLSDRRSRWLANFAGVDVAWDVETLEDVPAQIIVWRSVEGSPVDMFGAVRFESHPIGNVLRLSIDYAPGTGKLPGARLASAATARVVTAGVKEDLRRFKAELETGETPTIAGQSAGRHGIRALLARDHSHHAAARP